MNRMLEPGWLLLTDPLRKSTCPLLFCLPYQSDYTAGRQVLFLQYLIVDTIFISICWTSVLNPKTARSIDASLLHVSFLPPTDLSTVSVTSEGERRNTGRLKVNHSSPNCCIAGGTPMSSAMLDDVHQRFWLVALLPSIRHILVQPQLQELVFH